MDIKIKVKKRHPVNSNEETEFKIVLDRKLVKGILYMRLEPFIELEKSKVWLDEYNNFEDTVSINSNTTWQIF